MDVSDICGKLVLQVSIHVFPYKKETKCYMQINILS